MERKEIVKALGEHFGVKPKYMGAPSFAFQVTTLDGVTYVIDRKGKIKNLAGIEFELERLLNGPEDVKEEIETAETINTEIILPMDGHTGATLKNLVNMINSKQSIIKKVFGFVKDIVSKEFIEEINKTRFTTIDEFEAEAERIGYNKIPGLSFDFHKRNISFNFIGNYEDTEAAVQFVASLNKTSKEFKQSSPKPTETDNEKFTFRVFLIRLGFIGDEYKKARKILLSNLEGNSAFRKGKPEAEN